MVAIAGCELRGRCQPSLGPFGDHEENDADENDETDRRIDARQIVALGQIVDELAEAAEIDQILDADYVDQRENQPEPDADKNRRQRGRKQDLPELLRRRKLETAANIDEHASRRGEALNGLENDWRQA